MSKKAVDNITFNLLKQFLLGFKFNQKIRQTLLLSYKLILKFYVSIYPNKRKICCES